MHLKQAVLSYPAAILLLAVNVHGVEPEAELSSVPVKLFPQESPTEHDKVHPDGKEFYVKNELISNVAPDPPLAYE